MDCLRWEKFTPADVQQLLDPDADVKGLVAAVMRRAPSWLPPDDGLAILLVDLHFELQLLSASRNLAADKISTIHSILHAAHSEAMADLLTSEEVHLRFIEYLKQHTLQRPPFSTRVFDEVDLVPIEAFFVNRYLAHFPLWRHLFGAPETITVASKDPAIPVPLPNIPPMHTFVPAVEVEIAAAIAEGRGLLDPSAAHAPRM